MIGARPSLVRAKGSGAVVDAGRSNDDIDLVKLVEQVWQARAWVLGVTAVVMASAALYAFGMAPVVYETRALLLPPSPSALAIHSYAHLTSAVAYPQLHRSLDDAIPSESDLAIPLLTPGQAYQVFLRHLGSTQLRQQFFDAHYQRTVPLTQRSPSALARHWAEMNESMVVTLPSAGSQRATLTWRGEDSDRIAMWANQFVDMAIVAAQQQLQDDLVSELTMRLRSVQVQVDVSRQVGRTQRHAQIARTQEAWQIAHALGLEDPYDMSGVLMIDDTQALSYLQGSKALQAQLTLLRTRELDDPYIEALTPLRLTELLLSSIPVVSHEIGVARVDAAAVVPQFPAAPQRTLIMVSAGILGLILGCFAPLLQAQVRRKPDASEPSPETAR